MTDDMFDFEDVLMDVASSAGATSPLRTDQPRGTLYESSPLVASEVTGGVRGKEGVRLCLIRSIDEICGGEIKGGGTVVRFCSKPKDMCDVASHAKSKANIQKGCLYPYVPKKGENQVRLQPSLLVSLVPPDISVDMLLLEEKPIALWQTYMDACKASEFATGRNELGELNLGEGRDIPHWDEHVGAPNLNDLTRADDFKTPKKVRIIPFMAKEDDEDYVEVIEIGSVAPLNIDLSTMSPLEGTKRTSGNLALRKILSEWDGLASKFGNLKTRFLAHEAVTGQTKDDVVKQFLECNHYMNELGNKARLLASRIGIDERPGESETSVWESLNILQDEVNQGKEEIKVAREGLEGILNSPDKENARMTGKNLEKLARAYKKSMGAINARLIPLELKFNKMTSGGQDGGNNFDFNQESAFDSGDQSDVEARLQMVQDRVRILEDDWKTQERENEGLGGNEGASINLGGRRGSQIPSEDSASHESILNRLEILESRATDETCGFGGFNFSTIHDVVAFVTKFQVPTCAMYWDMLSVMVCMRSKGETGKEQSERKYAAQKANVHSALEADLVASMGHERPLCLYSKDKKELATHDKGFAACPSYKQWMSGGTQSFWYQLDYDFGAFCKGLTGRISSRGRVLSQGDLLAQSLIAAMAGHFVKLVAFINEFYRELVDVAKFRDEKAWVLVGQCVACVFEMMRPFRSEVSLIEDPTPVQNKSAFIWAVFQSHRVMEEFIALGFKGHPSIVKQMSLFMVTERVDPSEILGMMTKVTKAEAAAEKATTEAKRLTEANAVQKRKLDSLSENFETFKKKVNQKIF
jgi:hypothetical protein